MLWFLVPLPEVRGRIMYWVADVWSIEVIWYQCVSIECGVHNPIIVLSGNDSRWILGFSIAFRCLGRYRVSLVGARLTSCLLCGNCAACNTHKIQRGVVASSVGEGFRFG